jgi:hypothetical protein
LKFLRARVLGGAVDRARAGTGGPRRRLDGIDDRGWTGTLAVMISYRLLAILVLGLFSSAFAEERERPRRTEAEVIRSCLGAWPDNPFRNDDPPRYKVLGSSVNVVGIGGDVVDDEATPNPQLVLVKPAVNVLTKGRFRLMNPNGWYCFESAVTVLAKSEVIAHCTAHLTSSVQGVAVAGGNTGTDAVTVLGKAVVKRVGCKGEEE